MKGGDPQSLDRLDEDGLAIKALHDIASYEAASSDACAITRLPVNPASYIAHGWDICQPVMANGSEKDINRLILDELQGGVSTIWLQGLQTADLAGRLPAMMQDVISTQLVFILMLAMMLWRRLWLLPTLQKRLIPI